MSVRLSIDDKPDRTRGDILVVAEAILVGNKRETGISLQLVLADYMQWLSCTSDDYEIDSKNDPGRHASRPSCLSVCRRTGFQLSPLAGPALPYYELYA
jgi:hypothetical protein